MPKKGEQGFVQMTEEDRKRLQKQNEIVMNKKDELLAPPPMMDPMMKMNQEKQKKDFQQANLGKALRKKNRGGFKMNKNLENRVYNVQKFVPTPEPSQMKKPVPLFQERKKETLNKSSEVQSKIGKVNVEIDKNIFKGDKNENAVMKEILKGLEEKANLKKDYMTSFTKDPAEATYIKLCVEMDKLMRLHTECKARLKEGTEKKQTLDKIWKEMEGVQSKIQKCVWIQEKEVTKKHKKKEKKDPRLLPEDMLKDQKKDFKKETKTEIPVVNIQKNETKKETRNEPPVIIPLKKEIKKNPPVIPKKTTIPKFNEYQNTKQPKLIVKNQNNNNPPVHDNKRGERLTFVYNKQTYNFVKREPKDLQEAMVLRSQITKNFDLENGALPEGVDELYLYFQGFVDNFREQGQELQFDPEVIERIDVDGYPLETVVTLRNRITDGGILYGDLTGQAKATYDYYDQVVKRLRANDGTMKDNVEQHEKREIPNYNFQLKTNLNKVYEKQVPGSMDCWSCAGAGLINHFMRNVKDFKKVTQQEFRAFKPTLKTKEEMKVDQTTYDTQKYDIDQFTVKNQSKIRVPSPMGNPFMVADFYLRKLKEHPELKNTAVRKMVLQPASASKQQRGLKNSQGQLIGKDTNALHNLRVKFLETVHKALQGDSALAMLWGIHYVTIVGIRGTKVLVHNSAGNPSSVEEISVENILRDSTDQRAVELVWLQKIDNPQEINREFKNLDYDPNTGKYREKVHSFSESIGQKDGIAAWKMLDEKESDISDLVQEGIYVPETVKI